MFLVLTTAAVALPAVLTAAAVPQPPMSTKRALRLPSILASDMVMQHSAPVPVWGWGPPRRRVTVALSMTHAGRRRSASQTAAAVSQLITANGTFSILLPSQPAGRAPAVITVSADSQTIKLTGILFGTVVLCVGQSNMGLGVEASENAPEVLAHARSHRSTGLRLINVANTEAGCNATSPRADIVVDRPWSSPSVVSPANYSAACYFLGKEVEARHPGLPVGLITAAWGGVGIEVFMTERSLRACGNCGDNRGESNADRPTLYARCGKVMIEQWREAFSAAWSEPALRPSGPPTGRAVPFTLVQLAPWPEQHSGILAKMRYAQQQAQQLLPSVGMVVAADLGDPAGVFHPIHSCFKAEIGRRAALVAEHLVFGNQSVPLSGPQVVQASWNPWQPSWGATWHHGTPYDPTFVDAATACGFGGDPGGSGPWLCGGLRVVFDQDVVVRSSYGGMHGMQPAFELLNDIYAEQPLAINSSVASGPFRTLTLNTTFVSGRPSLLRYGWSDYPTLVLYSAQDGRPVAPFNISIGDHLRQESLPYIQSTNIYSQGL